METRPNSGGDATRWAPGRQSTALQRQRPLEAEILRLSAATVPNLGGLDGRSPVECLLELTDVVGKPVPWCEPEFFARLLAIWGGQTLTLRLASTPGAILNETILERLSEVRRRAERWRLVADSDGDGLASMAALNRLLAAPYDQIDFHTDHLPGDTERAPNLSGKHHVFSALRELVLLRNARRQDKPIVSWIYRPPSAEITHRLRAEALARQLQVDRFESAQKVDRDS